MKIGVVVESFRKPLKEAVKFAGEHGIQGIQLYASCIQKEFEGVNLDLMKASDAEIAGFRDYCKSCGVEISAVCGDVSSYSFQVESETMLRADFLKRVVDQTVKLGVSIITTHIGHIPECMDDPVYPIMVKGVREAAEYAASKNCVFAIETGPELADVLRTFIENVNSRGLGVNLDPANLRGVSCEDPVYAVQQLGKYIVHTHAKDAVNQYVGSSAAFYGMKNPDGTTRKISARPAGFKEVPLGQGMVPWDAYLAELRKAGFDGFLTIERECGSDPASDIFLAKSFLESKGI